jgi:hypothetical protein
MVSPQTRPTPSVQLAQDSIETVDLGRAAGRYIRPVRIEAGTCIAISVFIAAIALLVFVGSYFFRYQTIQDQLTQLYGPERTDRYLSPSVWAQAMLRLRLSAGLLLALAAGIAGLRQRIARALDSLFGSLWMSARHARRSRFRWNPVTVVELGIITLIGLLLRLRFAGQPMRYDESATVLGYASKPLYLGLSIYNEPNNHLFHTLLVHFAMKLAGPAEWAVRMPALVAGTVLCLFAYALARRLTQQPLAGLLTAALVSTSSILVEYSTNARGYTLICCATLALLICAHETLRRASPLWFALFALTAVFGFWTIPIFLIPFGGTVAWMVWEARGHHSARFRRVHGLRLLVTCLPAGAVTSALYLPPLAVNGAHALLKNQWVTPRNLQVFLLANGNQFQLAWDSWNRDLPLWWPWLMALFFATGLALFPNLRRLVLSLAAWTLFLFVARRFVPFARTWLLFLPIFLTCAAAAAARAIERIVPTRGLRAATITAVILAAVLAFPVLQRNSVLASSETGVLRSAPQIVAFVAASNIPLERVLRSSTSDLPLDYYWWRLTGVRSGNVNLRALKQSGVHHGWFLLNDAYGEQVDQFAARRGLRGVEVSEEHSFDGARLYRVTWKP